MDKSKIIAVDFDGTLCENKYPDIGRPNKDMLHYIKKRKRNGCKIILWTCRNGELLDNAVKWCKAHGLEFDAVNENLPEIIELFGSDTRKIFANLYIDDRAYGKFRCAPLLYFVNGVHRNPNNGIKKGEILNQLEEN